MTEYLCPVCEAKFVRELGVESNARLVCPECYNFTGMVVLNE